MNKIKIYLFIICIVLRFSRSSQSFFYEKMHRFGLGNRVIPNYRRYVLSRNAYPEPLPTSTVPNIALVRTPYNNLYQGMRTKGDVRVYRRRFNYTPKISGHQVFCEAVLDCIITHIAIETTGGIPIILRGGVGYRHFMVVAKARAGDELAGSIRAYCKNNTDEYYKENKVV